VVVDGVLILLGPVQSVIVVKRESTKVRTSARAGETGSGGWIPEIFVILKAGKPEVGFGLVKGNPDRCG